MSQPAVTVAAPYPEEGAVQLARAAEQAGRLDRLLMPSRAGSRALSRAAELLGRGDAARRLRRGAGDVRALQEVAPLFEPLRLVASLPGVGGLAPDIHRLKAGFDRRVAQVPFASPAIVCMPEAALATFDRRPDVLRVFHEVDGHPRARNEVLTDTYGARRAASEAHPQQIVDRIEAELALADLILSPSSAVTAQMTAQGVPEAKLLQAHLGVDLAAFAAVEEAPAATSGNTEPVLLYVGQISLRKGITFLIDAARGARVQVRLLGPVVDRSLLEGAPENVRYLGTASHAGVADAMRRADAFVFPTLEDAFGLVVVEAAASGLPVISTVGAGASEVLGAEDVLQVPIADSRALGEAMAATEPLARDERRDRAARIRAAAAGGSIHDWAGWSAAVLRGIDAALAARP